jgi:endonuclease/exonuclease/phosphatase family metal-dependent hydrolase
MNIINVIFSVFFVVSCLGYEDSSDSYELINIGSKSTVSFLTFNILANIDIKALDEGYATWDQRSSGVIELIENSSADFVAIQETTPIQLKLLKNNFLKKYFIIDNEIYSPDSILLVKREKYLILEQGHYLLEDPTNITRMRRLAVWVKVKDRETERELMAISVHIDNNSWKKDQMTKLMDKLEKNAKTGAPIILAGDFNTAPDSSNYNIVTRDLWKDSYIGSDLKGFATYPANNPKRRIDHILLHGEKINVRSYRTIETKPLISDHLPVRVDLIIEEE